MYNNYCKSIKFPDIIFYLEADVDILIERIKKRDRVSEITIKKDYLSDLNVLYENFYNKFKSKNINIIKINTNNINQYQLCDTILKYLS